MPNKKSKRCEYLLLFLFLYFFPKTSLFYYAFKYFCPLLKWGEENTENLGLVHKSLIEVAQGARTTCGN